MSTEEVKTLLSKQQEYVRQDRIQKMREYVDKHQGGGGGLFDTELTVKSMRSVRYFSEAHAAADIVDNAIEAGAQQIHVVSLEEKNRVKEIAIIDDGSGMIAEFLPWAASWGGSSQHGDEGTRNVFGRFGFGLPTASINRGTTYDVISRTDDGDFSMVTVDIRNLPRGKDGLPIQPKVTSGKLPPWLISYLMDDSNGFKGGLSRVRTVVVWRELDRLKSKSVNEFTSLMHNHFGVTYMAWLNQVEIRVNGQQVEPIDLLFTTPSARYFDVNGTRAEDHGSINVPIKDLEGIEHRVTVRMSRLTPDAITANYQSGIKGRPTKIRQKLRIEHDGILVTRHDRFIEAWKPKGITGVPWNPYMRQVCVHIDFPPELDEMFGITPDKQTISPRDEVIDVLNNRGIFKAIADLYKTVADERARLKAERDREAIGSTDGPSVTEAIMEKFESMVRPSPKSDDEIKRRREEAKENLEKSIKERATKSDLPEDVVRDTVIAETEAKRFKVELVSLGERGPVYNPQQRGIQTVLQINVDHKFFIDVYSQIPASQYEVRIGMELLLFTLAFCENEAQGERAAFYLNERMAWSNHLLTQMHIQDDVIAASGLDIFRGENSAEANFEDESTD